MPLSLASLYIIYLLDWLDLFLVDLVFVYSIRVSARFHIERLLLDGISMYIPWLSSYISCNPFRPLLSWIPFLEGLVFLVGPSEAR